MLVCDNGYRWISIRMTLDPNAFGPVLQCGPVVLEQSTSASVGAEEGVTLEAGAMETLSKVSGGDLRRAITTLQSAVRLQVGPSSGTASPCARSRGNQVTHPALVPSKEADGGASTVYPICCQCCNCAHWLVHCSSGAGRGLSTRLMSGLATLLGGHATPVKPNA